VQYANARYAEIVDNGLFNSPRWKIVIHTQTNSYHSEKETDEYKQAEKWLIEANTAIYRANHSPLCMKHALEIGYPFRVDGDYMVTTKSYGSQQVKGHELVASLAKVNGENISLGSFYPFKDHPLNPTHSDAEVVVNVYMGQEL
jgi:hypothetical protein